MRESTDLKVAYIGGGSKSWAFALMRDLALEPALKGELRLYDIDHAAARRNVKLSTRIFGHPDAKSSWHVVHSQRLDHALKGADFVVFSIEPGPVEMRYADLQIPRRYGIVQTVGDSTGPGGICRALRAVPVYEDYAHQIMKYCPSAWVINYTNPMTLCTAALYAAEPRIKAFGCCHEVFGTQRWLAGLVARHTGETAPPISEIALDISGVNHFTFAATARWKDLDLIALLREQMAGRRYFTNRTQAARKRNDKGEWFASDRLVASDLLRRLGALGAAGDRHLAEFVPWYLNSEEELWRWGVVCTPYSWRLQRERTHKRDFPKGTPLKQSGEEGVAIIKALVGQGDVVTNVNLPNRGQMPDMPMGAVVETYASFRRDEVRPCTAGQLPVAASEMVRRLVAAQNLSLQAAMTRNRDLVLQAMLSDPLVTLSTTRTEEMMNAMMNHIGWTHA